MKQIINDFINSIDNKLYSRIRVSKGDAECRRYLKEHLQKQLTLTDVGGNLNTYSYKVEHNGDGIYEHDADQFIEEKPYLLKTIEKMRSAGINPNIDDIIYGLDNIYYIKSICYYHTHCTFWVDEEKIRDC